jgi:hypothetical protein
LHSYFRVELSDEQLGQQAKHSLGASRATASFCFGEVLVPRGRWSDHVAQARSGVLIPKKAGAPPELRGNIRSISRLFSLQLCPLQCTWNGCLFRWPQPPDGVGFVAEKRTSAQGSRCAHSIVCLAPGSLWLFANLACSPTTITTNTIPDFVSLPSRP